MEAMIEEFGKKMDSIIEDIGKKKHKKKKKKERNTANDLHPERLIEGVNLEYPTKVEHGMVEKPQIERESFGQVTEEGDDEVMKPKRKKKSKDKTKIVRFREPVDDRLEENVTNADQVTDLTIVPINSEDENDTDYDWEYFGERNWVADIANDKLKYGKFSRVEDEKLKTAIFDYIKMRGWDREHGLEAVLHCSRYAEARKCWLDIAKALPHRPIKQINSRALRLLGGRRGHWSKEEKDRLKELQVIHGSDWKKIAGILGRDASLCKDKWRHLRFDNHATWTQVEYDRLSKLVRRSMRIRDSLPPRKRDRRKLRDEIHWEWISEEMQRDCARCAEMWYHKLASPMIEQGKWANEDDRLFLQSLMAIGATSEEAVDWDRVLEHRDGSICFIRWKEMMKQLGNNLLVPFEDTVEMLARRYSPDLLGIVEE